MRLNIVLLLVSLLMTSALMAEVSHDQIDNEIRKNPLFQKYGLEFSHRFSLEYAGEKTKSFESNENENSYQEFAELMREKMKLCQEDIKTADDFQKRYQIEKSGKSVGNFNNPKKEAKYQKFKADMELSSTYGHDNTQ